MRVLILGGTTQANQLAQHLAERKDFEPVFSLAGVTKNPVLPGIPVRIGGFGGISGLETFLATENIGAVVDATHPFAAQMSRHAVTACERMGLPLLRIDRPSWEAQPDDQWTFVPSIDAAVEALGTAAQTVFLTTGRKDLLPFQKAPHHHYVLRSIDQPDPLSLPSNVTLLLARPPFTVESEIALMRDHAVQVLVTKNAGADATTAKLIAARALRLPVIMIDRPTLPQTETVTTVEDALDWLERHDHAGTDRDV